MESERTVEFLKTYELISSLNRIVRLVITKLKYKTFAMLVEKSWVRKLRLERKLTKL